MTLSTPKKKAIRNALELKLRRCKGTRLQEFFAALMSAKYSDLFVPIGTDYSRGDLQCDGMLQDPLTIYACYGPVNAGANATQAAMATAVKKVTSDFEGAYEEWPELKAWAFVHNYVEVPAQIVQQLFKLRADHPGIDIKLFGKEQFENALLELDETSIDELIGDAATEEDFRSLMPEEVLEVVSAIMKEVDHQGIPDDTPVVVPNDKLYFNGLAPICRDRIISGLQNASRVASLLQGHQNPLLDTRLASIFKAKYLSLKAQSLQPDDILFELKDFADMEVKSSASREVAVWSLLAHLFERCTIFEDAPVAVSA